MIVSDLFLEVWKAAKKFLSHAVAYVADDTTSKVLFQKIFEPALNQLLETLNGKTTELLMPHQRSHPITYNHYFTETLQKESMTAPDECDGRYACVEFIPQHIRRSSFVISIC
jgi:hypothetical protein